MIYFIEIQVSILNNDIESIHSTIIDKTAMISVEHT